MNIYICVLGYDSLCCFVTFAEAESQEFQLRLTGIGRCSDWLLQVSPSV